MDNIDKLRELQNFDFHRDLESKHTIEKQTKNSYSRYYQNTLSLYFTFQTN